MLLSFFVFLRAAEVKPGSQYDAGTSVVRASWTLTMSERQRHTVNMKVSTKLVRRWHDDRRPSTTLE